jgi:hypothetical protein
MTRKTHPPHRVARWLSWSSVILVLSAAPVLAAPPPTPEQTQPVMRGVQVQSEPNTHRQPVQTVSEALGQRLDRMMLGVKPAGER